MDLRQGRLKEIMDDRIKGDPKTLGLSVIFGFNLAWRQLRRSSERASVSAATFVVARRCSRDLLYFNNVSA
jgi:hypothetical protein